jgi:hypothetical protein
MYCAEDGTAVACLPGDDCSVDPVYAEQVPCPAGYKCNGASKVACDNTDGKAQYSPSGASQCTLCPAGYFCPDQHHPPIECPDGW